MGSAGSGNFGTYRVGNNENSINTDNGENAGVGAYDKGGMGEIECPKTIQNIKLEDVATSEYYMRYQSPLATGEAVRLRSAIYNGRLVIEKTNSQEILGNLPTQYNYLINCIKNGLLYSGFVTVAGNTPIPYAVVTLSA